MAVEVTLDGSGDTPEWLRLDRERLQIRGTAPLVTEDQNYRLVVRAQAEHGGDSRLLVLLTITGQPDQVAPTRQSPGRSDQVAPAPQFPGHWAW